MMGRLAACDSELVLSFRSLGLASPPHMASRKSQMNRDALHQLLRARPALDRLLDSIITASAEEGRTTVDELLVDVPRKHAIALLRELEGLGYGTFKVGRKGYPSRFEWSIEPEELRKLLDDDEEQQAAEAAARSVAEPAPAPEKLAPTRMSFMGQPATIDLADVRPPADGPARTASRSSGNEIEHQYVLRPDYRVSLNLPDDLTPREAEVLGAWVRNLSFDR